MAYLILLSGTCPMPQPPPRSSKMATSRAGHASDRRRERSSTNSQKSSKKKMTVVSSPLDARSGVQGTTSRKQARERKRKGRNLVKRACVAEIERIAFPPGRSKEIGQKDKNRRKNRIKGGPFMKYTPKFEPIRDIVTVESDERTALQAKVVAGASLVKHKPLFSHDSKYLFVITNDTVRVYSTLTAECVHRLRAHSSDVVSISVAPGNHLQLISCYEDGKLVYWDYTDGIFHKEIKLNTAIRNVFFTTAGRPFYVLTSKLQLLEIRSADQPVSEWKKIFKNVSQPDHVVLGFKGLFAAQINKYVITVVFLDNALKKYEHSDHHSQVFTCIAAHPTEYCIATGDNVGRIFVWYNFKRDRFSRTVLHWHQLPVADLAFTSAGSNIVSGGGECAIVKWKIDSDTRTYVPRLGMPICRLAVSPDNSLIASCHVDNAIQFISNTGSIVHVIQGLTQGHQWKEFDVPPVPTGMLYNPQIRAMVLNGKPGHLQFYSLQEDKQLFNLDITGFNYQHSERNFKVLPTEVKKAAFDAKGNWLATFELRDDRVTSVDKRLKFWQYNPQKQNFVLNTSVEHAHLSEIVSLKFQPDGPDKDHVPLAITCGLDKRFKVWTVVDDSDIYRKRQSWICDSVGYFRDLTPGDVAFCADGTVVAITFTCIVTLWLPESNVLKASLSSPLSQEDIRQMQFGSESSSNLLVCASENFMSVWNVLSLTVQWCIGLRTCTLTKDSLSETMAVFTTDNRLFVFNPSEPKPIYSQEIKTPSPVVCAAFTPQNEEALSCTQTGKQWNANSLLYFMNTDQTLLQITDGTLQEESIHKVVMQQNLSYTPFGALIAQHALKVESAASRKTSEISSRSSDIIKELIMAPSNTLPPIKVQCASLFTNVFLLPQKKAEEKRIEKVREESESDESESEAHPFTFSALKEAVPSTENARNELTSKVEDSIVQAATRSFSWLRKAWHLCE